MQQLLWAQSMQPPLWAQSMHLLSANVFGNCLKSGPSLLNNLGFQSETVRMISCSWATIYCKNPGTLADCRHIALHCFACYNRFKWGWFQEIRCCWCRDTLFSVLWLQLPLSLTQQIHWHNVLWQAYSLGCTQEVLLVHFLKSKILPVIFQLTILSTGTFCRWILPYHANVLEAHYMVSVVCCRT